MCCASTPCSYDAPCEGAHKKTKQKSYCWLVACALLQATTTKTGAECAAFYVDVEDWECYEGDHWPIGDQFDCRLKNLRPLDKVNHRTRERMRWPEATLPARERGVKRPAAVLDRATKAAKANARARAAKAKAAPMRTRAWQ